MIRRAISAALASAFVALAVAAPNASAAPIPLVLPQGSAFSILGHSCGGIQEKTYATGFDAATGYPSGGVSMSTSCGGSGRGGGYHTTLYSGWATVIWDYSGAVVSYTAGAPSSPIDPSLIAYDQYGNEVYNQSNNAYLVLAAGFEPAPRLSSVSPASGPAAGGTTVTVTGTGFNGITGVSFGGVAAQSFSVASSTSLTAVTPKANSGTVDVTVTNAGGTSATSAADQFTFISAPTVTTVSPRSGPVAGGTTVTVTGTNFAGATRVAFGGTATGFSVDSSTSITATVPAGEAAGSVDVTVTNSGGTSTRSTADRFTYVAPVPAVADVSPAAGPAAGGTPVEIDGSGFTGATRVSFGSVVAKSFRVYGDTAIVAIAPAHAAGTIDVTVRTSGGTSTAGTADQYVYAAAPTVTRVNPPTGPDTGGTTVTITGTGLSTTSEVDFGGAPASFTVGGATSLTAVAPPGAAGAVDVTVTTAGGTSATSPADEFGYDATLATVAGVAPNAGPLSGGTLVMISGSGFTNAIEVDFGGVPAPFGVYDDTSLIAISPAGAAAGPVDVTVVTPDGTSPVSTADAFDYAVAPTVVTVAPATGTTAGGTPVTIGGTGFTAATEVDFGSTPSTFVVNSDTSITAVAPPGAAGTVDVTVTTAGGTSATTAADVFTYATAGAAAR